MREMWFTNRDNVNLLLEICRVGFQTPLSEATTLKKLIELYFHWEQVSVCVWWFAVSSNVVKVSRVCAVCIL